MGAHGSCLIPVMNDAVEIHCIAYTHILACCSDTSHHTETRLLTFMQFPVSKYSHASNFEDENLKCEARARLRVTVRSPKQQLATAAGDL